MYGYSLIMDIDFKILKFWIFDNPASKELRVWSILQERTVQWYLFIYLINLINWVRKFKYFVNGSLRQFRDGDDVDDTISTFEFRDIIVYRAGNFHQDN